MSLEILPPLSLPAVIALCAAACAAGAAVTRFSGPLACTWPQKGEAMLQRLNAVKFYRRVGDNRVAAGAFLLGVVMACGGLTAYAAAPPAAATATSAPERLPSEVGLNPAGAMASSQGAARRSRVTVKGRESPVAQKLAAMLARGVTLEEAARLLVPDRNASAADMLAYRAQYNNAMVAAGQKMDPLSPDETQRFYELSNRIEARKTEIRQGRAPAVPFFSDDLTLPGPELIKASLGADADEYNAYLKALYTKDLASLRDALIARPLTGPSRYTVPAGADARAVRTDLGVDTRGTWIATPAADGGQTYTRVSDLPGGPHGISRDQVQATLRDADAIARGADPAQLGLTPAGAATLMATVPASVRAAIGR